jgi:hypothetical protein
MNLEPVVDAPTAKVNVQNLESVEFLDQIKIIQSLVMVL